MTTSHGKTRDVGQDKSWHRRGLFAAAAAVVAGIVTRLTERTVEAGTDGDVVLGAANSTSGNTAVTCQTSGGIAMDCRCDFGTGVRAIGESAVVGLSNGIGSSNYGVYGSNASSSGFGVYGTNGNGVAVRGDGLISHGVVGVSSVGVGVFGQISSSSNANTNAIYGLNNSTYTGSVPGTGGFGIVGVSQNGHGLVGGTNAAGAAAVVGSSNGVSGAWSAIMYGPMIVEGNFTVVSGAKSAAVPHPDGSYRRLYCVESPESWFEDFGKGQLACGQAEVQFDADFAAVVNLDDYHVFLTPYGGSEVLVVTERTPRGFRVEVQNAQSTVAFSWRVVARRKDIAAPRFEPVTVPRAPELPTIPALTAPAPPPADRRRP